MDAKSREGFEEEGCKQYKVWQKHSSWMKTQQHHKFANYKDFGDDGKCSLRWNHGRKFTVVGCQMNGV